MKNIIVDMDNTLSYSKSREYKHPLKLRNDNTTAEEFSQMWKEYFEGCSNDLPVKGVVKLITTLQETSNIMIVTARDTTAMDETGEWLKKHGINYHSIWMRQKGDTRPASEIKREILKQIEKYYGTVDLAFDDDERNIKMFREENIPYVKVAV